MISLFAFFCDLLEILNSVLLRQFGCSLSLFLTAVALVFSVIAVSPGWAFMQLGLLGQEKRKRLSASTKSPNFVKDFIHF